MANLSIRNLDDQTYASLKLKAAENGRSMEAEVRALLTEAVSPSIPLTQKLAQVVSARGLKK